MSKIVFSTYDSIKNPYYSGGGARSIHKVVKKLSRYDEYIVISGRYPKCRDGVYNGVLYRFIGVDWFGPKISQLIFTALLPIYSLFIKFDIWFDSFTPPFSVSLLPIIHKNKVVGLIHMLSGNDMVRKYHLPFDKIERIGLSFYKNLIATSNEIKRQVESMSSSKVEVIPNSVSGYSSRENKRTHILYIGRIEIDQKGIDILVEAYSKLQQNIQKLIIAGSGDKTEIEKLKVLIANSRKSKDIEYVGQVEGSVKRQLIQDSVSIIVPSRFETFSVVCLESLANKIPLVTLDIDNLNWIPKECRIISKKINAESLSAAILQSVNEDKQIQNMIRKGHTFATSYSDKNIIKKYRDYIRKFV